MRTQAVWTSIAAVIHRRGSAKVPAGDGFFRATIQKGGGSDEKGGRSLAAGGGSDEKGGRSIAAGGGSDEKGGRSIVAGGGSFFDGSGPIRGVLADFALFLIENGPFPPVSTGFSLQPVR